ncbi:hypothetical protein HMF8227_00233 [Saliniradius amylolyticus]|uniref:Peptidase C39-like domain-containing protein n=1 Tax=Saliniradius amylolyticus TaxID=2183582 RepID=A0A2S2DZC1_9ALTE|nr:C39 family peptidase [Saliniradius amylolyticus]AWL10741.1 hypothetical protein HMF8227_00233 [Saliniradius amylolyticus]
MTIATTVFTTLAVGVLFLLPVQAQQNVVKEDKPLRKTESRSEDNPGAVLSGKEIPYWKQTNNAHEPERTCSLTSLAMVTDYFGFTDPSVNGRSPDYLFNQLGGVLQDVPALEWGFNEIARRAGSDKRAESTTTGTIQQLREAVTSGKLAIIHGWFTQSGHIVMVKGFDGSHYIVNDPNGRWNEEKWGSYDTSVSGEDQKYSKAAFEHAINDNGTGDDLWLHIYE